jgi:polar amino acid transport system substrate-binding protein
MFKYVFIALLFINPTFAKEIIVTGHPDYPPVIWMKDGKLVGSAVTIVKQALENLGHQVRFVPIETWGRAQEEVKIGRIDILLPPYKTPKREKIYSFPKKPFLMDKTALFYKRGEEIKFESFKDLKKYRGVAIINDSFGEEFDLADKKYNLLKRLTKTEQCLLYLSKGRTDYVIAGQNAALSVLSELGLEKEITTHEKLIIETGMYTAISKKSKFDNSKFKNEFFSEVEKLISMKLDLKATADALKILTNN